MLQLKNDKTEITAWPDGSLSIRERGKTGIQTDGKFIPYLQVSDGKKLLFSDASLHVEKIVTGLGEGIRWNVSFREKADGTDGPGKGPKLLLEVCLEEGSGDVLFSVTPLCDMPMEELHWPSPFLFEGGQQGSYSVLPMMQGILLPEDWPKEVKPVEPACFLERNGYMPWIGQVRGRQGWMAIVETPWDAGYELTHPAGGPTGLHLTWQESLGKIGYIRRMRLRLFDDCDYVTLCKSYRAYLRERGGGRTLREKAVACPKITELIGTPVIHTCIKSDMKEEASCYDREHPENNYQFTAFAGRGKQLEALAQRGVSRAYVHLDGWSKSGYDREHPDIWPPCPEAGGGEEMRRLSQTCRKLGYLLALHDQYRDYYTDAATYDPANAVLDRKGKRPGECTWNGGEQTYLCASLALQYVMRNYRRLDEAGIAIDGAYLDVFSVMRLDECCDPAHPMTRKECSEYRNRCFSYIAEHYGIVSSEEPLSCTADSLALCHHAPYPTMPTLARGEGRGIPVPLFNLVYHDCIMIPWNLAEGDASVMPDGRSGFLYALLNGGMAYLPIEATDPELARTEEVCSLHRLVAMEEMTGHEFVEGDLQRQRTTFANGVSVEVDFAKNTWKIQS